MKSMLSRKKSTIIAVSAIGLLSFAVSVTLAVSHDRSVMSSKIRLAGYHTLFTETFDAPQNWKTCETIDKTITVTNDSDSSGAVAVRVKLEEQWLASDGVTELPLVSSASGLTMAQINFTPNSGWTKEGSYYYYDTDLAKGATTSSLITGVTLNCDANLDTTATAAANADGVYANANYKLKITAQTIDAESENAWEGELMRVIQKKVNPDAPIDFTAAATKSLGNGNGINRYTENGQDVYYYRGEIDDNNIIWADKCWKIVRTTATGGTKMIYNGLPSDVAVDGETVKQCLATGANNRITVNVGSTDTSLFEFNRSNYSPADAGYMYGTRIQRSSLSVNSTSSFIFSNDISRNGSTYTLDTSAGQSISGTWVDERANAATRYHYFCTDGAASCDSNKIGYIIYFGSNNSIFYLKVGGYDNIERVKAAMFANNTSSNAKNIVETWFEQQNLDGHISDTRNYEDDLEDAIFCNDRSFYSGALKSKDSDAGSTSDTTSFFGAYGRVGRLNSENNYEPSLDCVNADDAFTKDSDNGNGKLSHKIGLITMDELTLAGDGYYGDDANGYLNDNNELIWTASPEAFNGYYASMYNWSVVTFSYSIGSSLGLRPMVSLKAGTEVASGSGLATDPYIVE